MSASTTPMTPATSVYTTPVFWERLWRGSGVQFVVFFIIAYLIYGYQPPLGASADALLAFYGGHRSPGNLPLTSALNDFAWASAVLSSFPRAMLIMAGTFGLWRARQISNALFAAGVVAIVLALLGGTTWLSGGLWAPDGAYTRFISPIIGFLWVLVVSRVLLARSPATRAGW